MKDTAIMLGADKQTAEEDMRKVLAFETSLALKKLYDQDYFTLKSIAEMQRDIPGVNLKKKLKFSPSVVYCISFYKPSCAFYPYSIKMFSFPQRFMCLE